MEKYFKLHYLLVCKTYFGRFMKRNFGRKSMKKIFTQGCIVWVWGDLKWTFSTTTVTHILRWRKFQSYGSLFNQVNVFIRDWLLPYRYQYHSKYEIFAEQGHNQTGYGVKAEGWNKKRLFNRLEKSSTKKRKLYLPRWRNDFNNQQKEHVKTN